MSCDFTYLGNGMKAIICGLPKDHVCNEDGQVLILRDAEEVPDTEENRKLYQNEIYGGSVCCTICGESAFSNRYQNQF